MPTRFDIPDDTLFTYYQLWRNLQKGTAVPHRRALPVELVRMIIRHAGLIVLDRTLTTVSKTSLYVRCDIGDPDLVSRVWFWAGPVNAHDVASIAQYQLVTMSCDLSLAIDSNRALHTWFDVGVFPLPSRPMLKDEPPHVQATDSALDAEGALHRSTVAGTEGGQWLVKNPELQGYLTEQDKHPWRCSHYNPYADTGVAQTRQGLTFTKDHPAWMKLSAGHVIAVRVCAQSLHWVNMAQKGELKIWKYFEPLINV